MKCPQCGHVLLEAKANFCSNCGKSLKPATSLQDAEAKSLQADVNTAAENLEPDDNTGHSPKRLNEEDRYPKRKRKKRKKSKKKRDENMPSDSTQSDLSLDPPEDNVRNEEEGDGSDSDNSVKAQDQQPKSLQDFSSVEHEASSAGVPPGCMQDADTSSEILMQEKQLPPTEAMEVDTSSENQTAPDGGEVVTPENTQAVHAKMHTDTANVKKESDTNTTDDKSMETNDSTQEITTNEENSQKNKGSNSKNQPELDENANEGSKEKHDNNKTQHQKKRINDQAQNQPANEPVDENKNNMSALDESAAVAPDQTEIVHEKGNVNAKGDMTQNKNKESRANDKSKETKERGQSQPPNRGKAPIVPQPDSKKETKANNSTGKETKQHSTNKNASDSNKQAKRDQHENEKGNVKQTAETQQQDKKRGSKQGLNQTQTGKAQQMVFGAPQKTGIVGSSVDPPVATMEVQQSEVTQASKPSIQNKDTVENRVNNTETTEDASGPKRPTMKENISAQDRLIIHFHAILSNDFKFDPTRDEIFIQAGQRIGKWEENIAVLNVTEDLGPHGFLIEGELVTNKSKGLSVSIPYKYVVYRSQKRKYEYEYIYKLDNPDTPTNRCLFVKDNLNVDGAWHQYDDIICKAPETGFFNFIKGTFLSQKKKDLIEGKEIAGKIMLKSIFDLLKTWDEINLKNFFIQLKQFFDVYSNPFVFEKKETKWQSLGYGTEDVQKMLKTFLLLHLIPQSQKEREDSVIVHDPLRAAIIMLRVCKQYGIILNGGEVKQLCIALSLPNLNQEEFVKYWEHFSHDASLCPDLTGTLLSILNYAKKLHLPHWILVLPLVHLLKNSTKPYEAIEPGNSRSLISWAGLEGIQDIENIKHLFEQDRRALVNLMKSHLYLKEIDVLLVRSWLHIITLNELLECSAMLKPELLDHLRIFISKVPKEISYSNFEGVSDAIAQVHEILLENKYSSFTENYRVDCLAESVKLLEKISKTPSYHTNYTDILVSCVHLVATISDFVSTTGLLETSEMTEQQMSTKDLLMTALNIIRRKIGQCFGSSLLRGTQEIELWNSVISVNFKDDVCTAHWRDNLTKDFEHRYKQETPMQQIEYYCTHIEHLTETQSYLSSCIEMCALDAVSSLCQAKSEGKLLERLALRWFGKFGRLISAIIEKSWPKHSGGNYCDDDETVLKHLLSWTASKNIFQLYAGEDGVSEKLSEVASERIAKAISSFTDVIRQLTNGNIKIRLLNIILERKNAFTELLQIDFHCEEIQHKNQTKMARLLQERQDEVKAVYYEKELVDILAAMSLNLEEFIIVDVDDLKGLQQVNIEDMPLNNFMEVHLFDHISSEKTGIVTFFHLGTDIRDMAEKLHTFRDCHVFKVCWKQHVRAFAGDENSDEDDVPLERIYEEIFVDCFEEYREIYNTLKDGSITLEKINDIFRDYRGKYEQLEQDLEIMCNIDGSAVRRWIRNRVQQIEQFHELHLAVASAEIIMKVKNNLHLEGDFSILENLIKVNQANLKRVELKEIDNDLMEAKKDLVEINETRKECLQELGTRGHFVNWVKEALEDINELKVFVDLASISAGENDMDVDRVACFHDAVLGYSSMLYELKPHSGFHQFKKIVQKLWKALENDPSLPKKLRDSARHIEWLKTVKDSHGSVELSSLSLASSINKKGIYLISAQSGKKLSLEKALKLRIAEEHDFGQTRNYSLGDLRELQNKLMLMSGKGDQGQREVDCFTEVFDSVQRLSDAFIALYAAGNPLFRHWEAQVSCCADSVEPSIMMDFNLGHAFDTVIIEGNIEEQLPDLCRKMEKCLEFWKDFVNKQRTKYYYLNYYTAEQIVHLCSCLSRDSVSHLDDQTLMMLSFVKDNCSATDLRQVWHELQYDLLNQPQEKNEDIEFQTFITLESGFSNVSIEFDLLPSLIQQASGLDKFDLLWNTYMKDMRRSLPHILDLSTLGRLLEIFANRMTESEGESEEDISDENLTRSICRELPNGLTPGKPNLVVCPHEEILTSCISTYMISKNEPLPTQDEVLLCTSSTQYEQVELFLRRCLSHGYRGHKLYSLLYADELTYDVSSKVESFFQSIKMKSREDYKLVIFCGSEREHAYLPTAFSQYKVHMVPQAPLAHIQKYLHRHYVVPEDQCSAAAAFKDRLCVGIVSSRRAGVGKSLYIKRLYQKLKAITKKTTAINCIRLNEPTVDEDSIVQSLCNTANRTALTVFHFDVTSSVQKGLHEFLFKLLFLRYLMDFEGKVWKCSHKQLYVMEILDQSKASTRKVQDYSLNDVFPNVFCRPPKEALEIELQKYDDPNIFNNEDPLMDDEEFRSAAFQRPYQYLTRFHNNADLDKFTYMGVEGTHGECLQMLLMHCGIMDPSWAELRNFAWFLNLQLQDCETSVFCDAEFTGDTLIGFKRFVVDFMILMAKDFATPSLSISDQSPGRPLMDLTGVQDEDLAPFLIRKRWETEPHPYIFFNDDHVSMTFIGFHLQPNNNNSVDAIDPASGRIIKRNVMTTQLYDGLRLQRVPFNIDFDRLPRGEKIERMCNVLGIQWPLDPDETYELTTDNILKILAIHMRFRCGIPVIIMGETGCGKTRLIKFLCDLRKSGVGTENMKLVKVHGGTTSDMIYSKVKDAETMAAINKHDYGFDSVLFFDEANTTEAVSSIKEVLCDRTIKGQSLTPNCGLQIIAACNPYRKHTEEMIERLESAGLGYRVRAEETDEKLGSIPLRQLVYRVHALPPSMIPLVWDFGQLNNETEKKYIQQIVQRVVESHAIDSGYIEYIVNVLSASQQYMRKMKDECSFVSLRDVERCMQAFAWFLNQHEMFFDEIKARDSSQVSNPRDAVLWSLVMATGVCYHACLEKKESYRQTISRYLQPHYSPGKIKQEITLMQDLLLNGVPMGDTIARNDALKENVFMMVLCIELRIPLFLVGKPGSSKSLSKTLVADAMQGQAAHCDLYKSLKQIHLVSFQCSPHSTPEGIINTFKQCGRFQEGKNLNEYISVVVLDEIGLAEDSPKMPLKTLHPLLEEGCIDDEPLPHKKVGFIGISNWALDPAKMNRGIFVSRGDPDEEELIKSAKGICSSDERVLEKVRDFFQPLAEAYLYICKQGKGFFGLRDYYSLIKMIFAVAKASHRKPSSEEIIKAVLRNFSGRDDVDAVTVFKNKLQIHSKHDTINAIEFVKENIQAIGQDEECRYLLLLTKNYAALQILHQTFFKETGQPEIIFGSSFPKDQEYTQICRNINRVKICMETGQTIVLLNLQNLYESLYDALNQYYVFLGGQKYVDLGLGTHRVKCRVHKDFRLIVIEERDVVYEQFPIPLINRLEKHYLDISTVLKAEQRKLVRELEKWVELFVSFTSHQTAMAKAHKYKPAEVFIGYHSDTCASVVLQVLESQNNTMETSDYGRSVLDEAKLVLLNCATPDSVVRLDCSELPTGDREHLARVYSEEQYNGCLSDYILAHIREEQACNTFFTEVTTFSRLLTASDLKPLEQRALSAELLSVQQFDTEHSFLKKIRNFLISEANIKILIIQCDYDETLSTNLVASAKYSSINEIRKVALESSEHKVFVYFISRLPRMIGGTSYVGFHGGPWRSVHIDDLRQSSEIVSDIKTLQRLTLSQLFEASVGQPEAMEVDDDMETEPENTDSKNNQDLAAVLDTTVLLRSCVQSAVGMLRDQLDSGFRSTQRVEILLTLLDNNDEMRECFNTMVKRHLHSLLANHVDNTMLSSNWVMKEAFNIDALQEGGTFRNTLWKRVQAVVVPMLAHLISIIDQNKNLDIILDENCGTSLKRFWLDIFGNEKFLEIPHLNHGRNSESRTILVQNHITAKMGIGCSLPFSWRIRDYLEDLWVHSRQHEGQTPLQFDDFFWKTPMGRFIFQEDQEAQIEFYQRYLQDFVLLTMNVTCEDEMELLCGALNCCVNELKRKLEATDRLTSLSWIHVAYHEFKSRLQNLSRIMCIEPRVTEDLLRNPSFKDGSEMVLDVYAAFACVERLEPRALDTDDQRQSWLRQVHKLHVPIELVCSEDSVRFYGDRSSTIVTRVQKAWNRIFCLSLFVEHMLLGIENLEHKLVPVVLGHTKRLWQVFENDTDLKNKDSFEAVIGLLKNCKDKAVDCIFRFGLPRCSVCIGDPQDPICLPCDHIYCLACIKQWLVVPGQMYCPLCMQPVNDDFAVVPSESIRVKINQHAQFRKRCNAFFVELVSSMCFKDNAPPSQEVILALLSFLMLEAHPAPIPGALKQSQMKTKEFSPFDESFDKSPVVRSVVLKLLLKYSFDKIKKYLQLHLRSVEQSQLLDVKEKTELYSLYINCFEDSMFEKLYLKFESDFLTELMTSYHLEEVSVDSLQQMARVRLNLDVAADLITEETLTTAIDWESQEESCVFLKSVKNFCTHSGNNWYRVYLIRKIASQHGVEHVQNLLKVQQMTWLFPEEVLQKAEETPMDQFLVCGMNYQTIRNAVAKVVMDGTADDLDESFAACPPQCKAVFLLLALYREVTTWYREPNANLHPKPEQIDIWMRYIEQSKVLTTQEFKAFARALVTNQLGPLALRPGVSRSECVFIELTIHLASVLLSTKHSFLGPLRQLGIAPATMQAAFIPTMPEDMLAVAQQAMIGNGPLMWYICPNGHPCTIGECGRPMQLGRCVDCGSQIGGQNHMPTQGFQAFQIQGDRTQTGHILGDARRRDNPDMMDTKSFSPVPFTLMRMVTHLAMFFGLYNDAQRLSTIIKPPAHNPTEFLLAHLKKDLSHLSRSLGKGADDTVSTVHLFINILLQPPQQQTWPVPYDNQLNSKVARNNWETEMNGIFSHHLKNLDRQLHEVNTLIRSDDRISASPIMKVLFGDPRLFLSDLPQNSLIHCSTVWSCREKVSLLGLSHILEQNDGKDTLPVLWKFLHREAEYRLVKFLPDILSLQKNLVKKFQNVELSKTIADFLQSQTSDSLKAWYKKHIDIFLTTWNQLRVFLETNGEFKLPPDFCRRDLDHRSDFRFLLPSRRGPGLCSTALVSYLIALHNDLVYSVDKLTGEETSYKVSPSDLTELHVIRYELDRDLMPLVLSNTQYTIEKGQETLHEYDLPKIQQQIVLRFLLGKPLITLNGLPTLVNRHDRNYEVILKDVKAKITQEPLQTLTQMAVTTELDSYSEVCDALSTVEIALGFLAMTGGDPAMQLSCYLDEVLKMGNQTPQHILKALSMCSLKHCAGLWQLLVSLKSEGLLKLKRDPFADVCKEYKKPIGGNERTLLTAFFSKNSADSFLLEMHEFLVLELNKPNATDTFKPEWPLKDTLVSYMERKDLDAPSDLEELFPEEICLSHYVETWKFCVSFKQERTQRL